MKKIILILVMILLVSGAGCERNGINENLAKCIGENSIIYVSTGCSYCEKQKDLFGSSFEKLNSVDCAFDPEKCRDADIMGVPTWVINNKEYKGVQDIKTLKKLTNC